jgi:hypothetical protein
LLEEESERLKEEGGEQLAVAGVGYDGRDLREANALKWDLFLERGLAELGKDSRSIREALKSAQWKVMLAAVLKRHTSAPNVWITRMLNMGIPQAVSQNVGKLHASGAEDSEAYRKLRIVMTQCPS